MADMRQTITALNKAKVLKVDEEFSNACVKYLGSSYYLEVYRARSGVDFPVNRGVVEFCAGLRARRKAISITVALVDGEYVDAVEDFEYLLSVLLITPPQEGEHGPYNWFDKNFALAPSKGKRRKLKPRE